MNVASPHECGVRIGFGIAVAAFAHALQLFLIFLPAAAQGIQCLPFLLFFAFVSAFAINKRDPFCRFFQVLFQFRQRVDGQGGLHFFLHLCKMLLRGLTPYEGISACRTFQLRAVDKHGLVIRFSLFLQQADILVEQLFHSVAAPSGPEPGEGRMVRDRFSLQQPEKVDPIPARLLQLPTGIDLAQITINHYLEHHPWIGCRFPPDGRIRFIQFPVIQFLKLGADQPDGCVLR